MNRGFPSHLSMARCVAMIAIFLGQDMPRDSVAYAQTTFKRPLVIAHRGGVEKYPENTIPAFQHAISLGVDMVECDVWLTADSQSVVIHDHTYGRTTNVEEVFGADKKINELTLAEAQRLFIDGGSGWDPKYARTLRVPTLREMLVMVKPSTLKVVVELKDQSRRSRQNLFALLDELNFDLARVYVASFSRNYYAKAPMKNVSYLGDLPAYQNLRRLIHTGNGLLFDGSFYLVRIDSSFLRNEYTVIAEISSLGPIDTTQYIYELTDSQDVGYWLGSLRIVPPNRLESWLRLKSGTIGPIGGTFDPNVPNVFQVIKTKDSLFVFVNGRITIKYSTPGLIPPNIIPRLNVGADRYGNRRFKGIMKRLTFASPENVLMHVELSESLKDRSSNGKDLVAMAVGLWVTDIFSPPIQGYSIEKATMLRSMGYGIFVWNANSISDFYQLVRDVNVDGIITGRPSILKDIIATNVVRVSENTSDDFYLGQNYPNPFNEMTWVRYSLRKTGWYSLSILDVLGREVRTLKEGIGEVGNYVTWWDGRNAIGRKVGSGVYFLFLRWEDGKVAKKMTVLR